MLSIFKYFYQNVLLSKFLRIKKKKDPQILETPRITEQPRDPLLENFGNLTGPKAYHVSKSKLKEKRRFWPFNQSILFLDLIFLPYNFQNF